MDRRKVQMNVIALSIDLGAEKDYEGIRKKALKVGAHKALVVLADRVLPGESACPEGKLFSPVARHSSVRENPF
jgi:argininosuccinate synthase